METTIVYRGYIGIMEKKMETTIIYWVIIGIIIGILLLRPLNEGGLLIMGLHYAAWCSFPSLAFPDRAWQFF